MSKITKYEFECAIWQAQDVVNMLTRFLQEYDRIDDFANDRVVCTALCYCSVVREFIERFLKEVKDEEN